MKLFKVIMFDETGAEHRTYVEALSVTAAIIVAISMNTNMAIFSVIAFGVAEVAHG